MGRGNERSWVEGPPRQGKGSGEFRQIRGRPYFQAPGPFAHKQTQTIHTTAPHRSAHHPPTSQRGEHVFEGVGAADGEHHRLQLPVPHQHVARLQYLQRRRPTERTNAHTPGRTHVSAIGGSSSAAMPRMGCPSLSSVIQYRPPSPHSPPPAAPGPASLRLHSAAQHRTVHSSSGKRSHTPREPSSIRAEASTHSLPPSFPPTHPPTGQAQRGFEVVALRQGPALPQARAVPEVPLQLRQLSLQKQQNQRTG